MYVHIVTQSEAYVNCNLYLFLDSGESGTHGDETDRILRRAQDAWIGVLRMLTGFHPVGYHYAP